MRNETTQRPLSSFSVVCLLLGMQPVLRVICFRSETPFEKTDFHLSLYRLELYVIQELFWPK